MKFLCIVILFNYLFSRVEDKNTKNYYAIFLEQFDNHRKFLIRLKDFDNNYEIHINNLKDNFENHIQKGKIEDRFLLIFIYHEYLATLLILHDCTLIKLNEEFNDITDFESIKYKIKYKIKAIIYKFENPF